MRKVIIRGLSEKALNQAEEMYALMNEPQYIGRDEDNNEVWGLPVEFNQHYVASTKRWNIVVAVVDSPRPNDIHPEMLRALGLDQEETSPTPVGDEPVRRRLRKAD